MKTPSFLELQTLVEYIADELLGSQLQEIHSSEQGLLLVFYRFTREPKTAYLVFDLDIQFPFLGLYFKNPWPKLKKTKPVGLFLNSHGKNLALSHIGLKPQLGRVVQLRLGKEGPGFSTTDIEFRVIPKQANFIVSKDKKSISWNPVSELTHVTSLTPSVEEDVRSIPNILNQWFERRAIGEKIKTASPTSSDNPYQKWKVQRERDLSKKQKALDSIQAQIQNYHDIPWSDIGDHLKTFGIRNLKPEWHQYLNFEQTVSQNMQNCFAKAKSAKAKIVGAQTRLKLVQAEIEFLNDLSEKAFETYLQKKNEKEEQSKKGNRTVEGRVRKLVLENFVSYMGKSAKDNLDLLRKAKAWDLWIHLKDYPSAYAIIHRQKEQTIGTPEIKRVAEWLIKENFKDKIQGNRYAVVYVECRHVRPIKGDKLGRVTYHDAREILIAL